MFVGLWGYSGAPFNARFLVEEQSDLSVSGTVHMFPLQIGPCILVEVKFQHGGVVWLEPRFSYRPKKFISVAQGDYHPSAALGLLSYSLAL